MNSTRISQFSALAAGALLTLSAQAAVVTSTVGNTTAYSDNFDNNSTGFTLSLPAILVNALFTTDDYLLISGQNGSAKYTVQSSVALQSLTVGFWYGASASGDAVFALNGTPYASAGNGMPFINYLALNPGAGGQNDDTYYTKTWTNLLPGSYTFDFRTSGQILDTFKLDDVTITATVPEPGSLALVALCLGGLVATRRRTP